MGKLISKPTPGVEIWDEDDGTKLVLLVKCPKCGKENWAPNVARGICSWCGYNANELLTSKPENNEKE
jgi:ribosomal protein L37E